jgi:hypothetical protein
MKRAAIVLGLAVSAASAQSTELGFPASALVEAGESKLFAASAAPGLAMRLEPSKPEESAKSEEGTLLKYTGKCYAKVDGSIRINGPCSVVWKTGEDASVSLKVREEMIEPEQIPSAGVSREGRKWFAYWSDVGGQQPSDRRELGVVRKRGSCWTNRRVRICESDS